MQNDPNAKTLHYKGKNKMCYDIANTEGAAWMVGQEKRCAVLLTALN